MLCEHDWIPAVDCSYSHELQIKYLLELRIVLKDMNTHGFSVQPATNVDSGKRKPTWLVRE